MMAASSLSDLGVRSEPRGRARAVFHDFEVHSGSTQQEIREKCTALPTGAVGAAQVRQTARVLAPPRKMRAHEEWVTTVYRLRSFPCESR